MDFNEILARILNSQNKPEGETLESLQQDMQNGPIGAASNKIESAMQEQPLDPNFNTPDKPYDPLKEMYSKLDETKGPYGVPLDVYSQQPPMVPPSMGEPPQRELASSVGSPSQMKPQMEQVPQDVPLDINNTEMLAPEQKESILDRLAKAQQYNKDNMQNSAILDSVSKIIAGNVGMGAMRGIEAQDMGADYLRSRGKQEVSDVLQMQQAEQDMLNTDMKKLGLDDAKQMRDPKSKISQAFKETLSKIDPTYAKAAENLSAYELDKAFPILKEKLSMDMDAKKLAASTAKESRMERLLDQRQIEEERRARMSQINTARNFLKDDPMYKDTMQQLPVFEEIDSLISQIEQGNETAVAALGTKLAKAMGEKGMLTDQDVTRYVNSTSWGRKLLDYGSKGGKGTLPKATINDIKANLGVFKNQLNTNVDKIYGSAKNRMQTSFPDMQEQVIDGILGKPQIKPLQQPKRDVQSEQKPQVEKAQQMVSDKVKVQAPNGKIVLVPKDQVEKAVKNGGKVIE